MADFIYGLIIGVDPATARDLTEFGANFNSSLYFRAISQFEDAADLESSIRTLAPSIVFLEMEDVPLAEFICGVIRRLCPATQVIGFAPNVNNALLLSAVRCGLRDVLETPLAEQSVHQSLARALEQLRNAGAKGHLPRRNRIHCFLPSKIGSGASTLALHTAISMSKSNTEPTALIDMDFDFGSLDFMLNLPAGQGLEDLRDFGGRYDDAVWQRVVYKLGNLDVVRSGSKGQSTPFSVRDVQNLIGYVRSRYETTCIDLPGPLNEHSLAALECCDSIMLVCTPELASVHMARRRLELLREFGLGAAVRVVVNRERGNLGMSKPEIEEVLQTRIFASIGNDYASLQKAILNGRPVDAETPLCRQFAEIARKLSSEGQSRGQSAGRSLWAEIMRWIGWSPTVDHEARGMSGVLPPSRQLAAPASASSSNLDEGGSSQFEYGPLQSELALSRAVSDDRALLNGSAWIGD